MAKLPTKETIHAWVQLHRSHRLLLDEVEKALKTNGLPPIDWYDVLLELKREKLTGLRQYEIGEKVLLNKHNLSRLIDRLENKKLVSRQACAEDGRGNQIMITATGEAVLKTMWSIYSEAIQDCFGERLSKQDTLDLSRILTKLLSTE